MDEDGYSLSSVALKILKYVIKPNYFQIKLIQKNRYIIIWSSFSRTCTGIADVQSKDILDILTSLIGTAPSYANFFSKNIYPRDSQIIKDLCPVRFIFVRSRKIGKILP